jgi:hypothetical protein
MLRRGRQGSRLEDDQKGWPNSEAWVTEAIITPMMPLVGVFVALCGVLSAS